MERAARASARSDAASAGARRRSFGAIERRLPRIRRLRRFAAVAWTAGSLYASYRFGGRGAGGLGEVHGRNARRLLALAIELQGLLIKVCQWLATRADLLPDAYVEVLSQLHDRVPPRPFREIVRHVESAFGRPVDEVCRRFGRRPIAAASLAQVHEAELWDGRRVAVKIQYPDIAGIVADDVRNLRIVLGWVRRLEGNFDFRPILDEIERYVTEELDFLREGRNAETIAALFRARPDVVVPKIVWELSSPKVLVMEFVDGIKVDDRRALAAAGVDRRRLAEKLARLYAEQILVHGVFHADPHPGNVFVQPADDVRVMLVDFGLVKVLPDAFRRGLAGTLLAILEGRLADAFESLGRLGFRNRKASVDDLLPLGAAMLRFAAERGEGLVSDAEMLDRFGAEMLRAYRENPLLRVPEDVFLVLRVLGILGGIERQLGAGPDLLEILRVYARAALETVAGFPGASR